MQIFKNFEKYLTKDIFKCNCVFLNFHLVLLQFQEENECVGLCYFWPCCRPTL